MSRPDDGVVERTRGVDRRPAAPGEPRTSVTVYPDGPLVIRGDFAICEVDGAAIETGRVVALCRCGRSAVKPLCDGSHRRTSRRGRKRGRDQR